MTPTGQENSSADWIEGPRYIYDYEVMLFSGGDVRLEIDGITFSLASDSFVIIPPGRLHVIMNEGTTKLQRYWCHFDWVYRGSYRDTPVMTFHPGRPRSELYREAPDYVPRQLLHGSITAPELAYDIHQRLAFMVSRSRHDFVLARALLLQLLIELLDSSDRTVRRDRHPELSSKIRYLLDERFVPSDSPPLMTDLLSSLGCSYEHACRVFRREYGVPPIQYVRSKRIAYAKVLLLESDMAVQEVSRHVGYNDPAHFTAVFRKSEGVTPTAFRDRFRKFDVKRDPADLDVDRY